MRTFKELFLFRWRTFHREPDVVFWVYVFPLVMTAAFGLALRPGETVVVQVGVVDAAGELAAELVAPSERRGAEVHARRFADLGDADRALRRGEVALVVIAGEPPSYRFDPTRGEAQEARLVVDAILQRARGRRDAFAARLDRVTTAGGRYVDFLVPGLIGMLLMNTTLWGVGHSLVQMRASRMLKRFAATPVPRGELLAAQVLSRLVATSAMAAVTLAFGVLVFKIEVQGRLLDAAALVVLGGLSFSGLSLLVGARSRSTEAAHGVLTLIALPMVLGSGVFFSSNGYPLTAGGFPEWLQTALRPLPLSLFNDSLRAVINDGEPLAARPGSIGLLAAWGLVPFVIAVRTFRWT